MGKRYVAGTTYVDPDGRGNDVLDEEDIIKHMAASIFWSMSEAGESFDEAVNDSFNYYEELVSTVADQIKSGKIKSTWDR